MAKRGKLKIVKDMRKGVDDYLIKLPFPKINPDYVSAATILTTILFLVLHSYSPILACLMGVITLLLDWADGTIARKYKMESEHGYIVDLIIDRVSEGIMLVIFFTPWFYIFIINNIMAIWSYKEKKHVVLPLRLIFLGYYFLHFTINII